MGFIQDLASTGAMQDPGSMGLMQHPSSMGIVLDPGWARPCSRLGLSLIHVWNPFGGFVTEIQI